MTERHVWKVTMRSMGVVRSECRPFSELVVSESQHNERQVAEELWAGKFSNGWWADKLILELEYMGRVWFEAPGSVPA